MFHFEGTFCFLSRYLSFYLEIISWAIGMGCMGTTEEICFAALYDSSCIGIDTKISFSYSEKCAIMLGSNTESLFLQLEKLYPHYICSFRKIYCHPKTKPFWLFKEGTIFQNLVWSELCKIPLGVFRSYSDVAKKIKIGRPGSVRAVANACGKNNIPIIIPCYCVI